MLDIVSFCNIYIESQLVQLTFCNPSFTFFWTIPPNQPNPFVNAANGSFWNSSAPGMTPAPSLRCDGQGSLPNPPNLPPCEGGRSSGRFAFSAPIRAKKASFCAFLPMDMVPNDGPEDELLAVFIIAAPDAGECVRPGNDGVLLLLPGPIAAAATVLLVCGCEVAAAAAFFSSPGTYSRPSPLAVKRAFHSSPTSPS